VTFADARVVDYLKRHFVLVWHNQAPAVPPSSTGSEASHGGEAYPEGGGAGNLRAYFCTSDARICYYFEGYWGPDRFLMQAQQGHDLVRSLTLLPSAQRPIRAGEELSRQLWDLTAERRRLRHARQADVAQQNSRAALQDAALGVRERAVLASADLFAQPVAPILDELQQKNRWLVFT
jgi:hypothetical protein